MQAEVKHLSTADLEASLDDIKNSPKSETVLDMIVSRPEEDGREIMSLADLDIEVGLVGDTWQDRPSARSGDGKAHPDMQITIMNSRVAQLVAQSKERCQTIPHRIWLLHRMWCADGWLPPDQLIRATPRDHSDEFNLPVKPVSGPPK